ncbi:hypothetical protein [Virgibacillus halodenitrificans]|uniref:hypothetical protein n=1 Tax=Virgibacillus halodenitrificans TaxID=1482 RepID=UPI002DBC50A0|nr:hypothetical protein [Virgibacillus halodenitrificans]MEC2157669.1 hypothetical protein [Virgibacillus halodenitrificans]
MVNILLIGRLPIKYGDDWQGFLGNYFGAIIGGLTAFLLLQLKRDDGKKVEARNSRSFVYIEEYYGHYRLRGAKLQGDAKLIETEEYKYLIREKTQEELDGGYLTFYKIGHKGYGETIFNCVVTFKFHGIDEKQNKHPIQKRCNLPMLSKEEEIYVPFAYSGYNQFEMNCISITYKTMANETIIFEHNLDDTIEIYYTTEVTNANKILVAPIKKISWSFPMQHK